MGPDLTPAWTAPEPGTVMRAWVVTTPAPISADRAGTVALVLEERPVPRPGPGEVLIKVEACAVCRTDLHLVEGDLPPRHPRITPGHQAVGRIVALGQETPAGRAGPDDPGRHPDASEPGRQADADERAGAGGQELGVGARAGVAWLRSTCRRCRYCLRGAENLCPHSTYTGWDAHGGYAEYLTAPADYVYPLPDDIPAERLAPLLCAGIIGYRALRKADLPQHGRLGIYGFGASAHLTIQAAIALGAVVHVVTRSERARRLAVELGAASAGDVPPEPLDAAILFAPVGDLVPPALAALDRGGTLAVAGIHLTGIPPLDYERHLFQERVLRSVTANTRADGRAYLRLAAGHPPSVKTTAYPFEEAGRALRDLANGQVSGAAVLVLP